MFDFQILNHGIFKKVQTKKKNQSHKGNLFTINYGSHFVILNALQYILTSGIFSSQDDDRKSKLDPMVKINAFLDETKQTESWKKEKRKKEKKQRKVVNICHFHVQPKL